MLLPKARPAQAIFREMADGLGWRYAVPAGRGTAALWLALRALARRHGPGEVILPDLLCPVVVDGILLAGYTPVFAEITPGRYTLAPESVAGLVSPRTRAILVAHLFGHAADIPAIRAAAPGIPLIEDAVQGLGGHLNGRPLGSFGDLAFISFDETKMIGGRGGLLFFDDESLLAGVEGDLLRLGQPTEPPLEPIRVLLPPGAAQAYRAQLRARSPALLPAFAPERATLERIRADWESLPARAAARNEKALFLQERLQGTPLALPEVNPGDSMWRYTVLAPSVAWTKRLSRDLQLAGLSGSNLYFPLSRLFGERVPKTQAARLADRLINLWVDEKTSEAQLRQAARILSELTGMGYDSRSTPEKAPA